jgi:hypothetical protein
MERARNDRAQNGSEPIIRRDAATLTSRAWGSASTDCDARTGRETGSSLWSSGHGNGQLGQETRIG